MFIPRHGELAWRSRNFWILESLFMYLFIFSRINYEEEEGNSVHCKGAKAGILKNPTCWGWHVLL